MAGAADAPLDPSWLAELANEFFASLPTQDLLGSLASQPSSRAGTSSLALGPAAPSLAPLAPQGAPAAPAAVAPRGLAQGVPEAYAAALPAVALAEPVPQHLLVAGASPYYFLADAPLSQAGGVELLWEDRVSARGFGLSGEDTLRTLLGELAVPGPAARQGSGPWFYFAEPRQEAAAAPGPSAVPALDVAAVRRDFPILQERVNGKPLVWFDNAATTQKPQAVIDRLTYFYAHENSNIHRAAHALAARATDAYEGARETVRRFIGAAATEEIIFVRGATEAINLVAKSWGVQNIGKGDEIVVSHLEHHANIVPWQQLAVEKGASLRVIPVDESGQILLDEYRKLLNHKTRLVAVTQVSNALGTVTPIREIVAMAHDAGARVLVDGAQSVSHMRVDVRALDADFFVFSGHKIFGPTGIGVVYGKREILENLPPWQGGGNMISDVSFERTIYQGPPSRFEAGTGNIADAVGLAAALHYVDSIGIENIGAYEHALLAYATRGLQMIPGLRLIGTASCKASVLSFVLQGFSTIEVGEALNREGIAVRTGHHCAQPILRRFGLEQTVRPSLAFYNTCEEVDLLVQTVQRLAVSRR